MLRSEGSQWAMPGPGMDKTVRSELLSSGLTDQAGEMVLRLGKGHLSLTEKTSFAKVSSPIPRQRPKNVDTLALGLAGRVEGAVTVIAESK